jgi:hypothetical protein
MFLDLLDPDPLVIGSVADLGCLARIPDPDFYLYRISDPGSKNSMKREGWKKISCHTFYKFIVATKITKLKIYLFLKC